MSPLADRIPPRHRRPEIVPSAPAEICNRAFWEKLRVWSQAFPPHPSEQDHLRRFEPLGLLAGDSPYIDPDPELAEILRSAAATGPTAVIDASTKLLAARGQWLETREDFNFNQHFFELGTIDTPDWKLRAGAVAPCP